MAYSQSGDGRIFLLLAIIPQIIAFSLLMVVQQAGWGFKHGDGPGSYIVLMDTTKVTTNNTQTGLPDSHDSSHLKDFFAIYPLAYCSGSKNNNTGDFITTYCSAPVRQPFDQQDGWKAWGVDIASKYGGIDFLPRAISVLSLTAACTAGLSIMPGLLSYLWSALAIPTTLFSIITTVTAMALASVSESLAKGLLKQATNYQASDTAIISITKGKRIFTLLWVISGMSGLATFFWVMAALGRRRSNRTRIMRRAGEADQAKLRDKLASAPRPLFLLARHTTDLFTEPSDQRRDVHTSDYVELGDSDDQPLFSPVSWHSSPTYDRRRKSSLAGPHDREHGAHAVGASPRLPRFEPFRDKKASR